MFSITTVGRAPGVVDWSVTAQPFQIVVVGLSVDGFGRSAVIPGCGSNPLFFLGRQAPPFIVGPLFLSSSGAQTGQFDVPMEVAAVPLRFQSIVLPGGSSVCEVGCPEVIGF